jgi:hypothetical protein
MNKNTSDLHCFYEGIHHTNNYEVYKPLTYGRMIKPLLAICIDENNTVIKIGRINFFKSIYTYEKCLVNGPYCRNLLNNFYNDKY